MRARETIAGARHLLEQPRPVDALVGRAMLSDGAMLLARAALQANQPSLNSAAKRLLTLARQLQPVPLGFYTMNNGDANDARLLDIARDRTLHPAARFVTIELMVAGACHRTREVLFGPSAARHDAVNEMINATRDIPRLVELRASFHRTLDKLERSPTTFMGDATAAPANTSIPQTLLRLLVPGKVQARIYACTLSGA